MNFKLLLDNYDKKMTEFNNINKYPYKIYYGKSDIDNTKIIFNEDDNLKFDIFLLSYIIKKNNKIKYIWSWSNLEINNNNNNYNEIKKLFEYGIKINNINDKFNANIKYYLINSLYYINQYELDIILAISLHILNGNYIFYDDKTSNNYTIIYILKKKS